MSTLPLKASRKEQRSVIRFQGGQQCWALWAFLAACHCTLFIDIISLFINWANKDACLLASADKRT